MNNIDHILNKQCYNYLNDNSSRENILKYIEYGNHVNIDKNTLYSQLITDFLINTTRSLDKIRGETIVKSGTEYLH